MHNLSIFSNLMNAGLRNFFINFTYSESLENANSNQYNASCTVIKKFTQKNSSVSMPHSVILNVDFSK